MSQTDSFIEEVTDAVRRDRLFAMMRRYGWIGILAVVLLVGGAAFYEFRKARAESAAQAMGDQILAAIGAPDDAARLAALQAIPAGGRTAPVVQMMISAEQMVTGDAAAAAETLRPLAESSAESEVYGDLAAFKMVLIGDPAMDAATRVQVLDRLARPGGPFRVLAMEQKAMELAAAGQRDEAIATAQALLQEPGVTPNLARRVTQLLVVLGGDLPGDANAG
ncbi:hypothetical protein [Tropicimonas sp. IMCC34043]|uniref:hypothetical protein n=1 Tax=Tropicimonas sp. IMCC34043 TaxID=2248760 RepID=UPI000E22CCE5|nr:hypothetical protein [Tropicimonas sp. IMCC34043]